MEGATGGLEDLEVGDAKLAGAEELLDGDVGTFIEENNGALEEDDGGAGAGPGTDAIAKSQFNTVLGEGASGVAGVLNIDLAGVYFEDGGGWIRSAAGFAGGEEKGREDG